MSVSTTRSEPAPPVAPIDPNGAIPPLQQGERLSREEFERRYFAMPHLKKAELIEGVVYVASPVSLDDHGEPHSTFIGWLFNYRIRTPGLKVGDNSTVRLDPINEAQPDCVQFIRPEHGGNVVIDEKGYMNGAPDLIAEIAASSATIDSGDKLEVYRRNGVREYIVWRVLDREVDWYVLRGSEYEKLGAGEDGILRSTIFPGLWLDPGALMREDFDTLLAVLQRGLETPEHADFKADLQRAMVERPA
jgi:Uma2 family endonuclease